jgi:hypothetical protein
LNRRRGRWEREERATKRARGLNVVRPAPESGDLKGKKRELGKGNERQVQDLPSHLDGREEGTERSGRSFSPLPSAGTRGTKEQQEVKEGEDENERGEYFVEGEA